MVRTEHEMYDVSNEEAVAAPVRGSSLTIESLIATEADFLAALADPRLQVSGLVRNEQSIRSPPPHKNIDTVRHSTIHSAC